MLEYSVIVSLAFSIVAACFAENTCMWVSQGFNRKPAQLRNAGGFFGINLNELRTSQEVVSHRLLCRHSSWILWSSFEDSIPSSRT